MSHNENPMVDAPIELVPYDPEWIPKFESERAMLARVLDVFIVGSIEHIGSTAVPGIIAKPVIDIMVGVESLGASRPAIPSLARVGYCYAPYKTEVMHWFCKPGPEFRTHHLHLVPFGSSLWRHRLRFRDALRASSHVAESYSQLKAELAARYPLDREAYTDGKSDFIARVLATSHNETG